MPRARHALKSNARSSTRRRPSRHRQSRAPRLRGRSNEDEAMRTAPAALVLAISFVLAVTAFAQAPLEDPRAAQQEAYRRWRETDPNLERDATSAGATL